MTQCSRKPAVAVLLAAVLAGTVYVWHSGAGTRTGDGAALAELEQAIARPDATTDTWLRYAQCLHQARRFDHAVMAYTQVLENDPYRRVANLQCAAALAQLGDADRLEEFVRRLVALDPRLALDVFGRPELQPYLAGERFQQLHKHAVAQSMD